MAADDVAVDVRGLCTRFGTAVVHKDLDLTVRRGEILAITGPSGSGKSTLLRVLLQLERPAAGELTVLGRRIADEADAQALRRRMGVLFQRGALFSALTVAENIGVPLREHAGLPPELLDALIALKLALVGLPAEAAYRLPAALSGGMLKRAGLARALALDPELLFLDEPSAGLDPDSAQEIDELMRRLRDLLGITLVVITHDLDTLWLVADRVAVLGEGRVIAVGSMRELARHPHPLVRNYFEGPRAERARP